MQLKFRSNNVKGLQGEGKTIKIFEYLKKRIHSDVFGFFKVHVCLKAIKKDLMNFWVNNFSLIVKLIHVVAIDYLVSKPFILFNQVTDQNVCILYPEVELNDEIYVLANNFNPNTE